MKRKKGRGGGVKAIALLEDSLSRPPVLPQARASTRGKDSSDQTEEKLYKHRQGTWEEKEGGKVKKKEDQAQTTLLSRRTFTTNNDVKAFRKMGADK